MSKTWRAQTRDLRRRVNTREIRQQFLIVCEGDRTEPNYFNSFRVPTARIKVLGTGFNTVSLVERAIAEKTHGEYDQVWCVFDRNSFPAENFNQALSLAEQNRIRVAYTNEAFELWYILHFNYCDSAISRKDYCDKLSDLLGIKYMKNMEDIYELLAPRQGDAIRNAKSLLNQYNPPKPERDNPSTTVHILVEQLNRFMV